MITTRFNNRSIKLQYITKDIEVIDKIHQIVATITIYIKLQSLDQQMYLGILILPNSTSTNSQIKSFERNFPYA